MIRKLSITLILLLFVVLSVSSKQRAILIGIGEYPVNSGWHKISSENDVALLKQVMGKDYIITSLENQSATKSGIIRTLDKLISESQPNDTVFIHFSCHGQQVLTDKKDEPDHLDEALIPYDAQAKENPSYHGEKHLLDDEFGELITKLRKKIGPSGLVIITLDACYSDSMDKGNTHTNKTIYRGGAGIFGKESITNDSLAILEKSRANIDTIGVIKIAGASDIVIISACKSYQKNMEIVEGGKGYGSLSFAIYEAFCKGTSPKTDISGWVSSICAVMKERAYIQDPQIRSTIEGLLSKRDGDEELPPNESDSNTIATIPFMSLIIICLSLIVILVIWKKRKP